MSQWALHFFKDSLICFLGLLLCIKARYLYRKIKVPPVLPDETLVCLMANFLSFEEILPVTQGSVKGNVLLL